jgi:hypothetical protein
MLKHGLYIFLLVSMTLELCSRFLRLACDFNGRFILSAAALMSPSEDSELSFLPFTAFTGGLLIGFVGLVLLYET